MKQLLNKFNSKRFISLYLVFCMMLSIGMSSISPTSVSAAPEAPEIVSEENTEEELPEDVTEVEEEDSEQVENNTQENVNEEQNSTNTESTTPQPTQKSTVQGNVVEEAVEILPTIRDLVDTNEDTTATKEAFEKLEEADLKCEIPYIFENTKSEVDYTFFSPSDDAILSSFTAEERAQLGHNLDELCELYRYHTHTGAGLTKADLMGLITTTGTSTSTSLSTLSGDNLISVIANSAVFQLDGHSNVTEQDLLASNGVMHVIDSVLLPNNPLATINEVTSNSTSPELSGTWSAPVIDVTTSADINVCVLVRIDGVAYEATVNEDGTWVIEPGMVTVDPLAENTLFSVVSRYCNDFNDINADLVPVNFVFDGDGDTFGDSLIALTMTREVLNYEMPEPEEPVVYTGNVLAATDTVEDVSEPIVIAGTACGKGDCAAYGSNNGAGNSDDNNNGDLNGDAATDEQANNEDSSSDSEGAPWYWWFIGGAAVVVLWYVLWRGGSEE